jgi:hypothetical protein
VEEEEFDHNNEDGIGVDMEVLGGAVTVRSF